MERTAQPLAEGQSPRQDTGTSSRTPRLDLSPRGSAASGNSLRSQAMRLGVYTDYVYRREDGAVFTERAFSLFLSRLGAEVEQLTIAGRLDPSPGRWHYRLPDQVEFVALPHYRSLARPVEVAVALAGSVRRFWNLLERVDVVWLLGPHPIALLFAGLAAMRRKRVVLGVRQDLPQYVRSRHGGRRWMQLAANLMEGSYRLLALVCPVVVVGPQLAANYRRSPRLLELTVSLIEEGDIASAELAARRSYDERLTALSVGRLDAEKNPLLLADVLASLRARDARWRLVVCGDGPLREQLGERLRALGLEPYAELRGYVPVQSGLHEIYRESHAFLHVSWTEGLPQVLFEAFAARLPVVATAVGGVAATAAGAALLIQPGDAEQAAAALARIAADPELRASLVEAGIERVSQHTLDAECLRARTFLAGEEGAVRGPLEAA